MRRRVRATFLLRCVILGVSLAIFAGVVVLVGALGGTLDWRFVLIFLALYWFVGIDGSLVLMNTGVLPWAIERIAVRRAERTGRPLSTLWFVDIEQQRRRELERFHEETRDNPTIR